MDLQCLKSTVNQQKQRVRLKAFRCHDKLMSCFDAHRDFCGRKQVKTILAFVQAPRKSCKFGLDLNHIYQSCFSKASTATNSPFTDFSIRATWGKTKSVTFENILLHLKLICLTHNLNLCFSNNPL